ncbi:MAG: hypothetical protein CM15mP53_04180 [Ectothiorhodospiraceae bacterium]|nr:MAG: hypothetical protein CM15mP53_04180 [Ectothiorhodospiraceae bacterium]
MKLKTKSKKDYEDDGLLPLVNIIFATDIFHDCWVLKKIF